MTQHEWSLTILDYSSKLLISLQLILYKEGIASLCAMQTLSNKERTNFVSHLLFNNIHEKKCGKNMTIIKNIDFENWKPIGTCVSTKHLRSGGICFSWNSRTQINHSPRDIIVIYKPLSINHEFTWAAYRAPIKLTLRACWSITIERCL